MVIIHPVFFKSAMIFSHSHANRAGASQDPSATWNDRAEQKDKAWNRHGKRHGIINFKTMYCVYMYDDVYYYTYIYEVFTSAWFEKKTNTSRFSGTCSCHDLAPGKKKNVRSCQVRMNHTTTKNLILKPFQMSLRHPYDSKVGKKTCLCRLTPASLRHVSLQGSQY